MPGVTFDYDPLDRFKRMAQAAARETATNIRRLNKGAFKEVVWSRGESVYVIAARDAYLGHVEEGLGTKCLVADAMYALTGKSYYDHVAQDTVAMIVNDMITLGVLPLSIAMHVAVGESSWFDDEVRSHDLIRGWKKACDLAGCSWGCGETPTLEGIIVPGTALLSGSAIGLAKPKKRLVNPANIQDHDAIVFVESSGIHSNGLTLARKIAQKIPSGYETELADGRSFGDTLLDPTHIYVSLVEKCLGRGIDIHYAVNVTGHGWRKLMRAERPFAYVIDELPKQKPIFGFLQQHGEMSDEQAYGSLNMGVGFALYVPSRETTSVILLAADSGLHAYHCGYVRPDKEKKVDIRPRGLVFRSDTLAIR